MLHLTSFNIYVPRRETWNTHARTVMTELKNASGQDLGDLVFEASEAGATARQDELIKVALQGIDKRDPAFIEAFLESLGRVKVQTQGGHARSLKGGFLPGQARGIPR